MLLLSVFTGCSSSVNDVSGDVTVGWENGVITMNGKSTPITSYSGYQATIENGGGGLTYQMTLDSAKDVTNITANTQQILEENMDKYKGKYYYTEYLGTEFTMAASLGNDNWSVIKCGTGSLPATTIAAYASDYADTIRLTNAQVYVDFGSFIFGNAYDAVTVRNDCALISGVAKVSIGTKDCPNAITVTQGKKEYQVMKGSSSKYDYYMYDGYLIQLAAGLDFSSYIQFK